MQPFAPERLPPQDLEWAGLIPLISRANRALATYAGILKAIPNSELLLAPLTTQEAVLSSKIEGTQATLGDVLRFEAGEAPKQARRVEDIEEILNYRRALRAAERDLPNRPFSLSMLKGLHGILLEGVRGKDHTPGQFRKAQNWIGAEATPIEAAEFVPPNPVGLTDHLESWAKYYHAEEADPLVQLAIVHAQFEIIHPFMDGNGRIGRILIPIFLFEKKILPRPMFYLSSWLAARRDKYIAKLRAIGTARSAWNAWCEFFLRGIEEQAAHNATVAQAILELYERLKGQVLDITHSQFAIPLLDQTFKRPIFTTGNLSFGKRAPSKPAIANLLRLLHQHGILKVLKPGAGRRATVYAFPELINLCEGKNVV